MDEITNGLEKEPKDSIDSVDGTPTVEDKIPNEKTETPEPQESTNFSEAEATPEANDEATPKATDEVIPEAAPDKKEKKKRKMKRSDKIFIAIFNPLLALVIAFLVVCLPFLKDRSVIFKKEAVYGNVFVAALGDKYERLLATKNEKIVVVGGSSVAFGLDSERLSQRTGMEVVNFGLYATLGSKIMLDLSEDGLNSGDIVIFAPELNAQTMSLYFGAKSAWQAIDANHSLYETVKKNNGQDLADAKDEFIAEKLEYLEDGAPNPTGVYNRANFNKYGDVDYDRPYNTMTLGYDPNTVFNLDPAEFSEDFIAYFNSYCEKMKEKGVTVYFSFCPINSLSLAEGVTDETIDALNLYFHENLNCTVISDLNDYIMDWGYFYDTNLHLNDAGVIARTERLANDLRAAHGLGDELTVSIPEPPGIDPSLNAGGEGDSEGADLFIYEDETMPDGTVVGVRIVGLSDKGKEFSAKELRIPASVDGKRVLRITSDSLAGLTVDSLYIGDGMSYIDDAAFRGASIKKVYLEFDCVTCTVSTPSNDDKAAADGFGFMKGAPEGCLIACPEEYRNNYREDYTWSHYYKYFEQ